MVESSHSDMLVARPCIFRELTNNGHSFIATMIDGGLEMGSLAAVAGRKLTPFHGADGAGALQGIGQRCPSDPSQRCPVQAWRAPVPRSRRQPTSTPFSRHRRSNALVSPGLTSFHQFLEKAKATPARRTRPQKEEDAIARVPPPPEIHDHRLFSTPVESSEQRRGSRN